MADDTTTTLDGPTIRGFYNQWMDMSDFEALRAQAAFMAGISSSEQGGGGVASTVEEIASEIIEVLPEVLVIAAAPAAIVEATPTPTLPPSLFETLLDRPLGSSPQVVNELEALIHKAPASIDFQQLMQMPMRRTVTSGVVSGARSLAARVARAILAGVSLPLDLLWPSEIADATLFNPRTRTATPPPSPPQPPINNDQLPEQIIWSAKPPPRGRPSPSPSILLPEFLVMPSTTNEPSMTTLPVPQAFDMPSPNLLPETFLAPSPTPSTIPSALLAPEFDVSSQPFPKTQLSPSPQPTRNPQPSVMTGVDSVLSGGGSMCPPCGNSGKKKRPKKPREECWRGEYIETAKGLTKFRKRKIPCQ